MVTTEKQVAIEYVRRGDLCPIETPIQIEELENGTRFIDPPNIRSVLYTLHIVLLSILAAVLVIGVGIPWRVGASHPVLAVLLSILFLYSAAHHIWVAFRFAKRPTIIEIGKQFKILEPSTESASYPSEKVLIIALDTSISFVRDGKWFNSLKIHVGGKGYTILRARRRVEIEWLVSQLLMRLPSHTFPNIYAITYSGTYRSRATKVRAAAGSGLPGFAEVRSDGAVLVFSKVNLATGARSVLVRVASTTGGRIEFRTQSHTAHPFAVIQLPIDAGAPEWKSVAAPIDPKAYLKGKQRVFLTFCGDGSSLQIEYFQLQSHDDEQGKDIQTMGQK
jgi:hypothetical protein